MSRHRFVCYVFCVLRMGLVAVRVSVLYFPTIPAGLSPRRWANLDFGFHFVEVRPKSLDVTFLRT